MSAKHGKNRATTLEQREAKRTAGSAGGIASTRTPPSDLPEPRGESLSAFPVRGWVELKDKKQCDLADRKIDLADIEIEKAKTELAKAKGSLVERTKLKESVHAVRDLIYEALVQVPAKVVAAIPDLPNNYKAPLALAIQTQIDAACAAAISEALKKHG